MRVKFYVIMLIEQIPCQANVIVNHPWKLSGRCSQTLIIRLKEVAPVSHLIMDLFQVLVAIRRN